MSTLLKCPRCSTQFDTETATATASGHIVCPNCSAKLRLRSRPAVAAPQPSSEPSSTSISGEIQLPGFGPPASEGDAASASATGTGTASSPVPRSREREPDAPLEPKTRLGGFELRRVIGRGGMATVYKATQLSLKRPVAVKVLAKRFSRNPVFVDRFDREAGALAGLNHPNIVNIIDKGVLDDHYFFVMELVEGITLDQLLHSVELTEQHYLHVIGEISKALAYVHSKGIIHRDIKPSNILVNKQGVIKVGDFGIAHMTDAEAPAERFGRNATVGTAHYMSPEQATNPGAVDQRADIYSLAVTFYKMFTRTLPPVGHDAPVTPPSELNPKLPKVVDAILKRAMNPDPAKRYSDVTEFCDALLAGLTAKTGGDLVGAGALAAGEGGAGGLLFNTNLSAAAANSSVTTNTDFLQSVVAAHGATSNAGASSGSGGTSLLVAPLEIPGFGSDTTSSGFGTGSGGTNASPGTPLPFPSPFAATPGFSRPEPAPVEEEEAPSRKKLYIILAVVVFLLLAVAGGLTAYVRMTAY